LSDKEFTTARPVLSDHQRVRKILIAPFNQSFGPLLEISWVRTVVPELLWIGLLHLHQGLRGGVETATFLSRAGRTCCPDAKSKVFAGLSDFTQLSIDEQASLRDMIEASNRAAELEKALRPLHFFYPRHPLSFLFSEDGAVKEENNKGLEVIKSLISNMYDRSATGSMVVQATSIWLAFDSGILKVSKELSLAQFPEIERYPTTELSRQVGASVRAAVNMLFGGPLGETYQEWPAYFWNRGLALEPCVVR
jgi:hypothetical protein